MWFCFFLLRTVDSKEGLWYTVININCWPQCGCQNRGHSIMRAAYRDRLLDGKLLFIFLSTFLPTAAEKFQKNAAQGRTYGSP